MILNEGVDFVRVASDTDQKAFSGPPERVLIPDGTRVYKWTDNLLRAGPVSPWWVFFHSHEMPGGAVFEGFSVHAERAQRLGKTHREYARTRLALSERFDNNLEHFVIATLNVMVWAFWGTASGQQEFKDPRLDHVFLIGGAHQSRSCEQWCLG